MSVLVTGILGVGLGCVGYAAGLFANSVDAEFVQSVGGIVLGEPVKIKEKAWLIPLQCDVSGTRTFSTRPTLINSALRVDRVSSTLKDDKIFITLKTGVFGKSSACPALRIENIQPGDYSMYYQDAKNPVLIGSVLLKD